MNGNTRCPPHWAQFRDGSNWTSSILRHIFRYYWNICSKSLIAVMWQIFEIKNIFKNEQKKIKKKVNKSGKGGEEYHVDAGSPIALTCVIGRLLSFLILLYIMYILSHLLLPFATNPMLNYVYSVLYSVNSLYSVS